MSANHPLTWIGGVLIVILAVLGSLVIVNNTREAGAAPSESIYRQLTRRVTSDGAPVLGSPAAPLTLVEFVDFSCSHCAADRVTIQRFITSFVRPGQARYELRILAGLDPTGSPLAARAALCAGEQNAFWEMSDALFQAQSTYGRTAFSETHITQIAADLNLNVSDLTTCTNNTTRYSETIQTNVDLALSLGVSSLPALQVRQGNGRPEWIELDGRTITGLAAYHDLAQAFSDLLAARQ
jgi:protein-disulfide isomerase